MWFDILDNGIPVVAEMKMGRGHAADGGWGDKIYMQNFGVIPI
jgi:hypothetical protein